MLKIQNFLYQIPYDKIEKDKVLDKWLINDKELDKPFTTFETKYELASTVDTLAETASEITISFSKKTPDSGFVSFKLFKNSPIFDCRICTYNDETKKKEYSNLTYDGSTLK